MKINYYKTNIGIFFKLEYPNGKYRVNGIELSQLKIFNGWYHLDSEIAKLEHFVPEFKQQTGWTLKNPALASDLMPLNLEMNAIYTDYDVNDREEIYGSHADYASLYTEVYETRPAVWKEVQIELVQMGYGEYNVSNISEPTQMKVNLYDTQYSTKKFIECDLSKLATYGELESILTPEPFIHTQPCHLTSGHVYKIIRHWVKANIDPKRARITSDYDFCFAVSKIIHLKPYQTIETQFYQKRTKSKTVTKTEKLERIFEMTWDRADNGRGYEQYTVIDGWKADSLQQMAEGIKDYLEKLMIFINSEVHECEHCSGTGHVLKKIETNSR